MEGRLKISAVYIIHSYSSSHTFAFMNMLYSIIAHAHPLFQSIVLFYFVCKWGGIYLYLYKHELRPHGL